MVHGGERMNFESNLPIYIQIMNAIKREIVSGKLKGGEKLASVREQSTKLKVNPNTIQRAYQELEREDLVFTQRGMGTFLTEDEKVIMKLKRNMASNIIKSFVEDMKSMGYEKNEIIELIKERVREE